jgi:uracil-DNA glycosylase
MPALFTPVDPFLYTSGPRSSRVLIVGEAWGREELSQQRPFVGFSGKELDRILFDAGINKSDCLCANLVDDHPEGNDFTRYLEGSSKANLLRGINPGARLRLGLNKLTHLISVQRPQLIIGCGNWPLWALTNHAKTSTVKGFKLPSGVMNWRGSQTWTRKDLLPDGTVFPYLPIIHPAAILRSWDLRYITCQDLRARAARFLSGKSTWSPSPAEYHADGNYLTCVRDLESWIEKANRAKPARALSGVEDGALASPDSLWLAVDVETWKRQYLCVVGISDGTTSLCIPFFYFDPNGRMVDCFTEDEELHIQNLLRKLLSHPNVAITGQNYSYDWQYLYRYLGITALPSFDTMLAHHLLWPGTPKSLDYLASLYCDYYCYWKDESQDWDAKGNHRDMWIYNCKDTASTIEITFALREILEKTPGMVERFAFQMQQWELANEMGRAGIRWDRIRAHNFSNDLERVSGELAHWLDRAMPDDLRLAPSGKPWYTSPNHQQFIFYDRLGISPILHKKTKRPTLDKESFEQLKKRAPWTGPIFDKLKQLRSVEVFRNNFLGTKLGPDGRMHPSFNVGGTETYRWSSSSNAFNEGMNLQNIPKLDEE